MYAICVECSHKRGMGNLFRSLNIVRWIERNNKKYVLLINNDEKTKLKLAQMKMDYILVDLWDYNSDWESEIINLYKVDVWINDRMNTDIRHALAVKKNKVKLCSFDDMGTGAELVDMNFCPMVFDNRNLIMGRKVYTGTEYMILDPSISQYRRKRTDLQKIIVTLGGSDTYGVTVKIATYLKKNKMSATISAGPCFEHDRELAEEANCEGFEIVKNVPSLAEKFYEYDLAITGGGITPFEACAAGLPCLIVANEPHEIQVGRFLEKKGCAAFVGFYEDMTFDDFRMKIMNLDISAMSVCALNAIKLNGIEHVMREIEIGR